MLMPSVPFLANMAIVFIVIIVALVNFVVIVEFM